MSQTALHRMTADEFLNRDRQQRDCRHALADGAPRAMDPHTVLDLPAIRGTLRLAGLPDGLEVASPPAISG